LSAITRRRFAAGAFAASAAPVLARAARAQTAVKIGTAVLGDSMAGPVIVALERGHFTAEGLAVGFVPFRGGPDLLKAVMVGECLVGISGSTDILVFREAGSPIKMTATHTEGNHFTLNVAPDVQRVGDLKGKAIGVTRAGATTWVFARMLARKEGWDLDRDVQIVGLGGLDAQLAALARREIAAYVWGDGGAVTELQGKSRVLLRLDAVTPRWISQIQYASEDVIRRRAEPIRKSQRALFRAIKLMRETRRTRPTWWRGSSAGRRRRCWRPTGSPARSCPSTGTSTWRRSPSCRTHCSSTAGSRRSFRSTSTTHGSSRRFACDAWPVASVG
jgi:ABC-type nitrate/sulfonate/bicarbonate transport system substrate-binding protein